MLFRLSFRAPQVRHYTSAARREGAGLRPWLPRGVLPEHCRAPPCAPSSGAPLPSGAEVAPLTEDAHEGGSKLCSVHPLPSLALLPACPLLTVAGVKVQGSAETGLVGKEERERGAPCGELRRTFTTTMMETVSPQSEQPPQKQHTDLNHSFQIHYAVSNTVFTA